MKRRTLALLLAAAMILLAGTALAAETGDGAPPARTEPAAGADPAADAPESPAEETAPESRSKEQEEAGETSDEVPEEAYIPDPVGSVSFANLSRRMQENNLQILSLQENIDSLEEIDYDELTDDLREQISQIGVTQWMMVQAGQGDTLAFQQMAQACSAIREQFDSIKDGEMQEDNADNVRRLRFLQDQFVMAGEATYIALASMEIQEGGLERQLAALDRQITELELRCKLGHVSSMSLRQAQAGRVALESGLSTLRMNLNVYRGQLEMLIGADITGEIKLGALPLVTRQNLEEMDLEKDLEAAKEKNWDLYDSAKKLEDARSEYGEKGGDAGYLAGKNTMSYMQKRHAFYSAKYAHDNAVENFEIKLRSLYLKTIDYQQILDSARTSLSSARENCSAVQLKYSQGTVSQNALKEAEDKVAEAREKVAAAENDLFSSYNTYRWAVDYGILN